jgi:serine protease AprX
MISSRSHTPARLYARRHARRRQSAAVAVLCAVMVSLPSAPVGAQLLKPLAPVLAPIQPTANGLPILGGLLNPILAALLGTTPDPTKLDSALRLMVQTGGTPTVRVIITTQPGQGGLVGAVLCLLGGVLRLTLNTVGALVADVPLGNLVNLTAAPSVQGISLDTPVLSIDGNLIAPPNAPPSGSYTLRSALGLPAATPSGLGVGVAVIDSGIDPQLDFTGRVSAFYDFTRGGVAATPIDPYGHGTHVSGIIASSGLQSTDAQYRGVGASARIIGLRVLDANGAGQTSQVLQAIEFAVNNRALLGIDVINLSLGHPVYEPADRDPLVRAVESAVRAGIVVVTAAGNYGYNRTTGQIGYGGVTSPGNAPSAITVGALVTGNTIDRADDAVAPYSSRGPAWYDAIAKPDLLAPGDGIISNAPAASTLYTAYPSVRVDAAHMRLNGTSMATAVTSGVAALLIEASRASHPLAPALTPNAIKAILQFTATPIGAGQSSPPDALTQGAGAVNVPAALDLAQAIDPSRPVGADWLAGNFSPYTVYGASTLPWSTAIAWGNTPFSGGLLDLNREAWSRSRAWGGATTWTSDIIQGNNLVWGSQIPWAAHIVWGGQMVGSCPGGQTFTWGSTDTLCTGGQTFTWGSTDDPSSTFWGNLATTPTGGETFTWGSSDPPGPPPQP